jgi:hypothetical protein
VGLASFLRRLVESNALADPEVIDDVISLASATARRPSWWASWRAGLSPAG